MACWQKTLEPTLYLTTKISADQRLMVALLLMPAILSQNSVMLDKAFQASCLRCIAEIRAYKVEPKHFQIDNPQHHYQIA